MQKKIVSFVLSVIFILTITGCSGDSAEGTPNNTPTPGNSSSVRGDESTATTKTQLELRFGESDAFVVHLYDNETAAAIAEYVGTADWRLPINHYDDYDNWEVMQYYDVPSRYEIPSAPEEITEEKAGAVYYSEPNRIVLFYQDAEVSGEYTPVGYIDDTEGLRSAVENNPVVPGWSNKLIHITPSN